MTDLQYRLLFLCLYPAIVIVVGTIWSFNFFLIIAGFLSCVLGILLFPLINTFFPGDAEEQPGRHKAKTINATIGVGGLICFIYLFIFMDTPQENIALLIVTHMIQFFLTGSTTLALYSFYIDTNIPTKRTR